MKINPAVSQLANQIEKSVVSVPDGKDKHDDFAGMLMDVLKEVNGAQQNATHLQEAFMTGQPVEYHDLMIASEKAGIAMQLTLQIRNKFLEAYQEINRMQI